MKKPTGEEIRSITKEALIEALKDLPDGAVIAFASDYGDICHTQQLHTISGALEEMPYEETAYSDSGFGLVDDNTASDEDLDAAPYVWVLS